MKPIPVRTIARKTGEPGLSGDFGIRSLESMVGTDDMVEGLHRHDFFYLLALKKASGHHEIDFVSYDMTCNTIFLMRPGQVHQLTLKAGSTGYLVQFKNEFFNSQNQSAKDVLRNVSHLKLCRLDDEKLERLISLLDAMNLEFSEKREGFHDVIKSILNIFFIELVRNRHGNEPEPSSVSRYAQEKLEIFFDLLDKNLATAKQVSYFADKLNLTSYQLNAITKSLLGKTPSELINAHIVLEAKRQLLATSNQVNQIAYQLGYNDPSYFIRFFKKHTGFSPESFRANSK